uniref:Uncharacterized protein n=1 Tax=Populus alba TaxID=43335 RepID=A0A4U5Q7E9_POPAL|nr:hypothetical protein D5086_0000143220 [Populus alba]
MAEALLSPILEQLTTIVAQQVQEEVNLVVGVKKQCDKLKSNLLAIQSVLEDADRKQVKDKAVRDWVDKLKDACYDMDDVLDEWSTAILRWKMEEAEENTRSLQKIRCSFLRSPRFCLNQVVRRRDIAFKIKEVLDASKLGEATMETSIERVRHLSMMLPNETSFPVSIHKAKGLRSLLIDTRDAWLGAALPDVFKQLRCIRSLNLSMSPIKEIPNEVGKLIHLRHLNLVACRELESLPETICDLCNLQSLDVAWCDSLKDLPFAIGKLIKLRHLRISGSGVAFIPKGIERITGLRTLDGFTVCGGGANESKAANLRELKNLNRIGSLVIWNLRGGEEYASDAAEAQLKNKNRLLCLQLDFNLNRENNILIEVLQPPSYLENLTITRYGGLDLPNWMMTLTRLQVLTLGLCTNVEVLPPLGRLPNLERMVLRSMKVRRLDAGFLGIEKAENASIKEGEIARVTAFPKLKKLLIMDLKEVEEWEGHERRVGEEDANTTPIISIMPQLRELMIVNCPLLRALPDYVLAAPLQELIIRRCPILTNRYGEEKMGEVWQKISHIIFSL